MSSPRQSASDLVRLAQQYAQERQAPVQTLIKELLHFEILQAMTISGAMQSLVFQGGTCLRLCYSGNRYSEDLDFAGGKDFKAEQLNGFVEILEKRLAAAYGLEVDIKSRSVESDGLQLSRWQAKVVVPQADVSLPQRQVINIEVADVPAHDVDVVPVAATYAHLSAGHRSLMVAAESREEILADKIKALVARPYLKYRDIWDIKYLVDQGVKARLDLVRLKLQDYGWTTDAFLVAGQKRLGEMAAGASHEGFMKEMSRFVDAPVARMIGPKIVEKYMRVSNDLVRAALEGLQAPAPSVSEMRM